MRDVSFQVHHGEVLGFAGLVGAGRTELAKALFGEEPIKAAGSPSAGKTTTHRQPAHAIRAGIGFTAEDRKKEALFMTRTCARISPWWSWAR